MYAQTLLADFGKRGIALRIDGEKLRYKGPITESDIGLLKTHKPALLAHLKAANNTKPPLPDLPCPTCNYAHFWQSDDGWLCGRCHPRPVGFAGDSVVTATGDKAKPNTANLPTLPASVLGVPIADIIKAAGDDADLLGDRSLLLAFAQSLLADGLVTAPSMPNKAPSHDLPDPVCCDDCQHFIKDDIGDGSGVGQCAIDASHHHDKPLYPTSERRCESFSAMGDCHA